MKWVFTLLGVLLAATLIWAWLSVPSSEPVFETLTPGQRAADPGGTPTLPSIERPESSGRSQAPPTSAGSTSASRAAQSASSSQTEAAPADTCFSLVGDVRNESGNLLASQNVRVEIYDRRAQVAAIEFERGGKFELQVCQPGQFMLVCRARGYHDLELPFTLSGLAREVRQDVTMFAMQRVLVRARTTTGEPFERHILTSRLGDPDGLKAIATRSNPGAIMSSWGTGTEDTFARSRFDGSQAAIRAQNGGKIEPDMLGVLSLLEQPPMEVSLVYEGLVLATRRLQPQQTVIEFIVAPEPFRSLFATVRVRFVADGAGESQLLGKASLSSLPFLFQGTPCAGGDEVTFSDIRPGEAFLALEAEGFEHFVQRIWIEPGSATDLGLVRVGRVRSLRGFVQTPEGQGLIQQVSCLPLGHAPESERKAWSNLGGGAFAFENLGPHSYAVFVSEAKGDKDSQSWGSPVRVIDLAKEMNEDIILTVQATTTVTLSRDTFDFDPIRVELVDPHGVVRFRNVLDRWSKHTVLLAPGAYTLIVTGDEGERKRIVFEVGERDLDFHLD